MAKFRLNSTSVFTLGGNSFACPLSADLSESIETFMSACVGNTYQETVTGLKNATVTVSGEVETDDVTAINNFAAGTNGALVLSPASNTAGDITITSTSATVVSRDMAFPSSGLASITVTMNLDDLTIAAIGA